MNLDMSEGTLESQLENLFTLRGLPAYRRAACRLWPLYIITEQNVMWKTDSTSLNGSKIGKLSLIKLWNSAEWKVLKRKGRLGKKKTERLSDQLHAAAFQRGTLYTFWVS